MGAVVLHMSYVSCPPLDGTHRSRKFGWDWFFWNFLLAATPPVFLWYSLAKTRTRMESQVALVREEIDKRQKVRHCTNPEALLSCIIHLVPPSPQA
jgi:hypothetical protein